jgi:hypothetical protein
MKGHSVRGKRSVGTQASEHGARMPTIDRSQLDEPSYPIFTADELSLKLRMSTSVLLS